MIIHKEMVELLGYHVEIEDWGVMPTRIDADDTTCKVEFTAINDDGLERTLIRTGMHDNFIFSTTFNNYPITINLKTGVVKKVRIRNNNE